MEMKEMLAAFATDFVRRAERSLYDFSKGAKTVNFVGIDNPTIKSYDCANQNGVD